MRHQNYRDSLLKMWDFVKSDEFNRIDVENVSEDEEYTTCGLCNPEFGAAHGMRTLEQPCPFDKRTPKEMSPSPCMDSCRVFIEGKKVNWLKSSMSKFIIKMLTAEAIASIKSIAKAGRGQKGVSKEAVDNHIVVANKIQNQIKAFGGFDFRIEGSLIKAQRSEQ